VLRHLAECFLSHAWWIAQSEYSKLAGFGLSRDFCNRCLRWFLWGRAEVDLDFLYLVSFDSEEFRVPGTPAIHGFAVVEDEGFVVSFKHLLNLIGWGLLTIGPAAFEIGFAVNAIVVRTGKYEVVAQYSTALRSLFS
jgi:hypothetical protein